MTFATSPRSARAWRAIRFAGLVLVAMFLAHDAMFALRFGTGHGIDEAMSTGGHDGWWTPFMALVGVVGALLALGAVQRLCHLDAMRGSINGAGGVDAGGPRYRDELLGLWRRLLPVVGVGLLVQENVEHLAVNGRLVGFEPLAAPTALLAIGAVTLLVAAIGALVRWRIHALEARLAAARRAAWPRQRPSGVPRHARTVAALLAHRWLLARQDPGRAPPSALRS